MRQAIQDYISQLEVLLNFQEICWWVIDYEYDSGYFYCNELMEETFSLDKSLEKHSVALTCPIAGDYNKNIELAEESKVKAQLVFDEYNQLIQQEIEEYNNQFPYFNKEKNKTFYFSSRARVVEFNEKNEVSILMGIIVDITKHHEQTKELQRLSQTDPLTGLYNRFKLDESLTIEIDRFKRNNNPLSLIMVDIDKFKTINDEFGHLIGDEVIKQIATILKENTRKIDVVGRWGGEEFIVLCPSTAINDANELAEKLRRCFHKTEFQTQQEETASFGISEFQKNDSVDSFINKADYALYQAKAKGRDRVEMFNEN